MTRPIRTEAWDVEWSPAGLPVSLVGRAIHGLRTTTACLAWTALAATLCGLFLHPRAFLVAAGVMLIVAVGLAWPWITVRGLVGTLGFDRPRGREGEPAALHATLRNRLPWTARDLVLRERGGAVLATIDALPGWSTARVRAEYTPRRRGEHPAGVSEVACGFPFGLRTSARPLEVDRPLLAWPQTWPVGPWPDDRGGHAADGHATRDSSGDRGDPLGVRPYRRGDPIKRIHWGQTARHGELIVCEAETHAVPRIRVVLDLEPEVYDTGASREAAIRVAASFAEGWTRRGADVELIVGGRPIAPSTVGRPDRFAPILDALARLDLAGVAATDHSSRDRALVVAVTTRRGAGRFSADVRLVVLDVGGLAGSPPIASANRRIWLRIAGPGDVAAALRSAGKESASVG